MRGLLVDGANAFAAELYAQLARGPGNLTFSPYSIHSALTLASAGAGADTADEMARVLHLPSLGPRLHESVADLRLRVLRRSDREPSASSELTLASAMWGQRGQPFNPAYVELARASYGAVLREVDFLGAGSAARDAINAWVATETAGKIKSLVGPGELAPITRFVLATAIFFKSAWLHRFFARATADAPFHLGRDTSVRVRMMRQEERFTYLEGDGFQAVTLPYGAGECSMVIVVPRAVDGLAALEQQLTPRTLAHWSGAMADARPVRLWLPRFSVSSRFDLALALTALGLAHTLGPTADFKGILEVPTEPLRISTVIHAARVEVDEHGTEAAAATVLGMMTGRMAAPVRREPVAVKADRPFLYVVRQNGTGAILFMGRVADPRD